MLPAALNTGRPLYGGGPLHGASEGGRRRLVLHVVQEAQLVEPLLAAGPGLSALRRRLPAGAALRLRAVRVAEQPQRRRLVPLDPGVVVAHDVLVVEARQQRHLALDAPELLAGRVDLDALHGVVAAVQFVLDLEEEEEHGL